SRPTRRSLATSARGATPDTATRRTAAVAAPARSDLLGDPQSSWPRSLDGGPPLRRSERSFDGRLDQHRRLVARRDLGPRRGHSPVDALADLSSAEAELGECGHEPTGAVRQSPNAGGPTALERADPPSGAPGHLEPRGDHLLRARRDAYPPQGAARRPGLGGLRRLGHGVLLGPQEPGGHDRRPESHDERPSHLPRVRVAPQPGDRDRPPSTGAERGPGPPAAEDANRFMT